MEKIEKGLLTEARWCPSPNFGERPDAEDISLIVVHNISLPPGEFGTGCVQDFFQNQLETDRHPFFKEIEGVEVSSHLFIERSGQITQFVPFHRRAWHAGKSSFCGRDDCNDFSVGIELEGTDTKAYTKAQYQSLVECCVALLEAYPQITAERICGHEHIAPGRKTDPGPAFDWDYLHKQLQKSLQLRLNQQ